MNDLSQLESLQQALWETYVKEMKCEIDFFIDRRIDHHKSHVLSELFPSGDNAVMFFPRTPAHGSGCMYGCRKLDRYLRERERFRDDWLGEQIREIEEEDPYEVDPADRVSESSASDSGSSSGYSSKNGNNHSGLTSRRSSSTENSEDLHVLGHQFVNVLNISRSNSSPISLSLSRSSSRSTSRKTSRSNSRSGSRNGSSDEAQGAHYISPERLHSRQGSHGQDFPEIGDFVEPRMKSPEEIWLDLESRQLFPDLGASFQRQVQSVQLNLDSRQTFPDLDASSQGQVPNAQPEIDGAAANPVIEPENLGLKNRELEADLIQEPIDHIIRQENAYNHTPRPTRQQFKREQSRRELYHGLRINYHADSKDRNHEQDTTWDPRLREKSPEVPDDQRGQYYNESRKSKRRTGSGRLLSK